MTDTTHSPSKTLANLRKAAERKIGFTRRGSEDRVLVRRADLQWLLTRCAGGDAIPAGMKAWHGGDSAPGDYAKGEAVLGRDGNFYGQHPDAYLDWRHGLPYVVEIVAYTPKPPAGGDAGESQRAAYASIAANKAATKLIDRMLASLGHMADGLADQKSSWADYASRLFTESQDAAHADRLAALALLAPVVEGERHG